VKVDHPDLGRLKDSAVGQTVLIELWGSVDEAADIELMQMAVGPPKGSLENLVELGKVESDWQFESAADLGLNIEDMNLGEHNEAVWIEGVKHAADHAAYDGRRQWMGRLFPSTCMATRSGNPRATSGFWPARKADWVHGAIALSDQAGMLRKDLLRRVSSASRSNLALTSKLIRGDRSTVEHYGAGDCVARATTTGGEIALV
jgi:hypothetical protein